MTLKLKNSIFICKKICMFDVFPAPYFLDILMQRKTVTICGAYSRIFATQKELISYAQTLSLLLISKIDNLGEY